VDTPPQAPEPVVAPKHEGMEMGASAVPKDTPQPTVRIVVGTSK
jgi:hypothetical protein